MEKIYVEMQSGKKEIRFDHAAIYKVTKMTGREIFDLMQDLDTKEVKDMKLTTIYEMLFCGIKGEYEKIEEMLEDFKPGEFNDYTEKLADSLGKHIGGQKTVTK